LTIVIIDARSIILQINKKFASGIVIDNYSVMLQIVASLADDSRGVIYNCNVFIVQVTDGP
jgi:hypothetical protein